MTENELKMQLMAMGHDDYLIEMCVKAFRVGFMTAKVPGSEPEYNRMLKVIRDGG